MRPDRIVGIAGNKQQACCQFDYKGYKISFSMIFQPSHTCVFAWEDEHSPLYTNVTIEQAIRWVDEKVKIDAVHKIAKAIMRGTSCVHCTVCDSVTVKGTPCHNCGCIS